MSPSTGQGDVQDQGCFSKPLRHLHNTLALLELAEQMAESADTKEDKSFHTAQVTPARLQTYYHLAMYENVSGARASFLPRGPEVGTDVRRLETRTPR